MSDLAQLMKDAIEADKRLSPEQRAVNAARQKRSYVVSEMMWGGDAQEATGKDAMTREEAERIYDATDAGALLAGYERLRAAALPGVNKRALEAAVQAWFEENRGNQWPMETCRRDAEFIVNAYVTALKD